MWHPNGVFSTFEIIFENALTRLLQRSRICLGEYCIQIQNVAYLYVNQLICIHVCQIQN